MNVLTDNGSIERTFSPSSFHCPQLTDPAEVNADFRTATVNRCRSGSATLRRVDPLWGGVNTYDVTYNYDQYDNDMRNFDLALGNSPATTFTQSTHPASLPATANSVRQLQNPFAPADTVVCWCYGHRPMQEPNYVIDSTPDYTVVASASSVTAANQVHAYQARRQSDRMLVLWVDGSVNRWTPILAQSATARTNIFGLHRSWLHREIGGSDDLVAFFESQSCTRRHPHRDFTMARAGSAVPLHRRQMHRGFTLAEVLVALAILLVGVVVALRIFPTGFDLFNEAQQTHQALKLLHQALAAFEEDRQGLPDAILPVDYTANGQNWQASALASTNYYALSASSMALVSTSSAVQTGLPPSSQWLMGYVNAVDYEFASASATQLSAYLAPDGSSPLWEPPSVRAMRRIIGERCQIPSAVYVMSTPTGSTATNVSMLPAYVPRFAPAFSNGHFTTGGFQPDADPVIIYDLRYKRETPEQLQGLLSNYNQLPDDLYYCFDYANQQLLVLPDAQPRNIRLSFYYQSSSTSWQPSTPYKFGQTVVPSPPNTYSYVCTSAGTSAAVAPNWPTTLGATISDGSVQWQCQVQAAQGSCSAGRR